MANSTTQPISIDQLLLDLENPRHSILQDQDDAMNEMINNQGNKLINLARDILENGTSPMENIGVMLDEEDPTKYVVLEGNRRIAAIKLLNDPTLASKGGKSSLAKFFNENSLKFRQNPIYEVFCTIFDERKDASHWIKVRHTGEIGGIGIVSWDNPAISRYNENLGKPQLVLQLIEFVKKYANLDEATKQNITKGRYYTSVQRLIDSPDVRYSFGMRIENEKLEFELPTNQVIKGLTKIVTDFANKKKKVADIYNSETIKSYLDSFASDELPRRRTQLPLPLNTQSTPIQTTTTQPPITPPTNASTNIVQPGNQPIQTPAPPANPPIISTPSKKSIPPSTNRTKLIPPSCILKVNHSRINNIYQELRKIEVDEFPNAVAIMLRVFLELSLEEYAKIKSIRFPKDPSLAQKFQSVSDYLVNNNLMSYNELKSVRVAYSSQDALFSVNTLHAYIHNKDFAPNPNYLKITWDNLQKFFTTMWQ